MIGDRAIANWLDCLEEAQCAAPRSDVRHRLEHFADIAVLDWDIFAIDPNDIAETRSRLTLVNGAIAYSDGTLAN